MTRVAIGQCVGLAAGELPPNRPRKSRPSARDGPEGPALRAVRVYTDGASRGNPGPAGIGVVVCDADDRILRSHREFLGEATNNEAEYRAILRGLRLAATYTEVEVELTTDSELAVRQLTGRYRIRGENLKELAAAVREAEGGFARVVFRHAPRMTGRLALADRLANEALDRRASG